MFFLWNCLHFVNYFKKSLPSKKSRNPRYRSNCSFEDVIDLIENLFCRPMKQANNPQIGNSHALRDNKIRKVFIAAEDKAVHLLSFFCEVRTYIFWGATVFCCWIKGHIYYQYLYCTVLLVYARVIW